MLTPKIRPQIHDLPHTQRNQHAHSPNRKPLHSLIGALISIPELHLPRPQKVHLVHHLLRHSLQPPQLRLHGPQLLASLDGRPVLRIGADVDVQFDGFGRVRCAVAARGEDVLEADVEGGVGDGSEGAAGFAADVAWSAVVVS